MKYVIIFSSRVAKYIVFLIVTFINSKCGAQRNGGYEKKVCTNVLEGERSREKTRSILMINERKENVLSVSFSKFMNILEFS